MHAPDPGPGPPYGPRFVVVGAPATRALPRVHDARCRHVAGTRHVMRASDSLADLAKWSRLERGSGLRCCRACLREWEDE